MTARLRTHMGLSDIVAAGIGHIPPSDSGYADCRDWQDVFDRALDHLERTTERKRRSADVLLAKKVCRGCQLRDDCAVWGLDNGEKYGLWGGLTPQERTSAIRRIRRQK